MDIYHYYGNDIVLNSAGDMMTVNGVIRSQQRILRRLLTNPGDYWWHVNYGAGLPRFIGIALSQAVNQQIQGLITSQMFLEESVAKIPLPVISLQQVSSGIVVTINYTDAPTQTPQVLTFTLTK